MKKLIIPFIIIMILLTGCKSDEISDKKSIGVSIIPQKTFVKKIVGDKFNVVTLIPPGSSPTSHQPSVKELEIISQSDLYFSIGVPTENANILPTISEYENLKIIDLQKRVDEFYQPRYFGSHDEDEHAHEENEYDEEKHVNEEDNDDHNHEGRDPHIWLSPKRAIKIVEIMTDELSRTYPDDEEFFRKNANSYIQELKELDNYAIENLSNLDNKSFLIYHPSYGYFADDYNLEMIAIERDGKDSSINQIDSIVNIATKENIKTIYYQEEMSSKQAKIVANEINGQVYKLKPLSPNYIESLKDIVNQLVGE